MPGAEEGHADFPVETRVIAPLLIEENVVYGAVEGSRLEPEIVEYK